MGYEKQEPRNGAIFFWGVVSALTLAGLIPFFHTYFDDMIFGERADKTSATEAQEQLAESQAEIDGASVSLSDAMDRIAQGNRRGTPVAPRATDSFDGGEEAALGSLGALKGWSQNENEAAEAHAREAISAARRVEQARRDAAAAAATAEATEGEGVVPTPAIMEQIRRAIGERIRAQ